MGTVWTLEVNESVPELRFLGRNRCRDMVDKSQSYLSFVQRAVSLFLPYLVLYVREPGPWIEISSKKEIQKLIYYKIQSRWAADLYNDYRMQKTSPSQ